MKKINKKIIGLLVIVLLIGVASYSYARVQNKPDLTVSDITFFQLATCPSNVTGNISNSSTTLSITMYVNNIGNATALNFTDTLKITGGGGTVAKNFSVAQLTAGETISHSVILSRRCFEQTKANATTDSFNKVNETNENNNNRVETYTPA